VRLDCDRGRKYQKFEHDDPHKRRDTQSKKIECPFHINIRAPKTLGGDWHITTIATSKHNHKPRGKEDILHFGREALQLTKEQEEIIHRSGIANVGLKKTLAMLRQIDPHKFFVPKMISNRLQKAKATNGAHGNILSDAAQLLIMLTEKKNEDDRWVVEFECQEVNGKTELKKLFWMSPEQRICYDRCGIFFFFFFFFFLSFLRL